MSKREDLTGRRFGRLTAIEYYGKSSNGHSLWLCECDCGNTKVVNISDVKAGKISSCGCYQRERHIENATKHNMCKEHPKLYNEHYNMIQRCHNENCKNYTNYGGRGIKVCDRWRESIRDFYDDVSALPHFEEDGYSLDRIDNDGDYAPNNVRWATNREQNMNRRNTLVVEYNGKTHTLLEWSDILGIPYDILYQHYRRAGRDLSKVIGKKSLRIYTETI